MLFSMCSCAPWVSLVVFFCFVRAVALDLVKICYFQLVMHVAQKLFDLRSWNFTGMLMSMCSLCNWVFLCGFTLYCRVIVLDFVKICNFLNFVACSSKSIWPRFMKIYMIVDQHVKLCTWCFLFGLFLFCFFRIIVIDLIKFFNFLFCSIGVVRTSKSI
jgi:hypothetical protein